MPSTHRPTISLTMIVRNVDKIIGPCLDSIIPYVDEVVVADTGSSDLSKEAIRQRAPQAKILDFNHRTHPHAFTHDVEDSWKIPRPPGSFSGKYFLTDFGAARQFAHDHATSDFVMWLDSDDVFEGGDKLHQVIEDMHAKNHDACLVNYDYAHDGRGNVTCKLLRERIFRRNGPGKWLQPIHEVYAPIGLAAPRDELNVVHRRQDYGIPPEVNHRNLKVLLKWFEGRAIDSADARMVFYLAMEERFLWPDRAINHFQQYCRASGWDEERAVAHLLAGTIHEQHGRHHEAFAEFSQAALEAYFNPDPYFAAARCAYFRRDWAKCIEWTEKGFEIAKANLNRKSTLMFDPLDRVYRPYIYLSVALVETGQWQKAIEACKAGLEWNSEDPHLKGNLEVAERMLKQPKEGLSAIKLQLRYDEPIDSPPANIPNEVLASLALQFWKRASADGDHLKALTILDNLPGSIVHDPKIRQARERTQARLSATTTQTNETAKEPTRESKAAAAPGKLKICIWTGPAWEKWSPRHIDEQGIGGSETAAVLMARELHLRGHQVTVLSDCGPELEGKYDGVTYHHYDRAMQSPKDYACDVYIISRQPSAADIPIPHRTKILWVHDIHVGQPSADLLRQLETFDSIFCLSEWHKNFFHSTYRQLPSNRIHVTRNGIDISRFQEKPVKKGNRLIFSSSPDRGLDRLIELMPQILERVPNTELHVYYGFDNWKKAITLYNNPAEAERLGKFEKLIEEESKKGYLHYHGRVNQRALAQAFLASKVWAYPTWFTETSCISAMEAQAAECVPVTSYLAALTETVTHGYAIRASSTSEEYANVFVKRVISLLSDEKMRADIASVGRQYTLANCSWSSVAREWEEFFHESFKKQEERAAAKASGIEVIDRPLRVAAIYGLWSSQLHGKFEIPKIFVERALTGSESCFFNTVKGLSEEGYAVDAFCDVAEHSQSIRELSGAHVYPVATPIGDDYDAYISWNQPDELRKAPEGKLRICAQQLNDFDYCLPGYDKYVDTYVMPSETHRSYLAATSLSLTPGKTVCIPNSINLDFISDLSFFPRKASLIWSSSPDRGLHIALTVFEKVRQRVPHATFRIFYRFAPWYNAVKDLDNESGHRARTIFAHLKRVGTNGENGVFLMDARPNIEILATMKQMRAQLYTCEPIRFTEGFSVSIMDACSTGCVPIISDADALGEIYGGVAHVIPGAPSDQIDRWVDDTVRVLEDDDYYVETAKKVAFFAASFDRKKVVKKWMRLIQERLKR